MDFGLWIGCVSLGNATVLVGHARWTRAKFDRAFYLAMENQGVDTPMGRMGRRGRGRTRLIGFLASTVCKQQGSDSNRRPLCYEYSQGLSLNPFELLYLAAT